MDARNFPCSRRLFVSTLGILAGSVAVLGGSSLGARSTHAQGPEPDHVVHLIADRYSRQKPFTNPAPRFKGDWSIPNLPDRVRDESWLMVSNGAVVKSVGVTRGQDGVEVQRTVETPSELWVYYPTAHLALQFQRTAASQPAATEPAPGATEAHHAITAASLGSQRSAQRAWRYYADLNPVDLVVDTSVDAGTGLQSEDEWAVDRSGVRTLIFERKEVTRENLASSSFTSGFWDFSPPLGITVRQYPGIQR